MPISRGGGTIPRRLEEFSVPVMNVTVRPVRDEAPSENPTPRPGRRVPSLDLLRTMAIVSVVSFHVAGASEPHWWLAPLQVGVTGVDLFFVLSGWLLGRQLALELRDTGTIRITRFWVRRWMRTLPAYYVVLLLTLLEAGIVKGTNAFHWSYVVFAQNYLPGLTAFPVSWSLCVEEHFYLLVAPAFLLFARARGWRVPTLVILLAAPSVFRVFEVDHTGHQTHVSYDACALGVALAAISVFRPPLWGMLCRSRVALAGGAAVVFAVSVWAQWYPEAEWADYNPAVYPLIFGGFVVAAHSSQSWQTKLDVPGARYIATRAYSIYLLHTHALALLGIFGITSFVLLNTLTWIVTLPAAEALHRFVERPVMKAREQFEVSRADSASHTSRSGAPISSPRSGEAAALGSLAI